MTYTEVSTQHLTDLLNMGVCRFSFRKKDGSIRNALGTRNPNLIPKWMHIKEVSDVSKKSVVYFDLEEQSFRSIQWEAEVAVL